MLINYKLEPKVSLDFANFIIIYNQLVLNCKLSKDDSYIIKMKHTQLQDTVFMGAVLDMMTEIFNLDEEFTQIKIQNTKNGQDDPLCIVIADRDKNKSIMTHESLCKSYGNIIYLKLIDIYIRNVIKYKTLKYHDQHVMKTIFILQLFENLNQINELEEVLNNHVQEYPEYINSISVEYDLCADKNYSTDMTMTIIISYKNF